MRQLFLLFLIYLWWLQTLRSNLLLFICFIIPYSLVLLISWTLNNLYFIFIFTVFSILVSSLFCLLLFFIMIFNNILDFLSIFLLQFNLLSVPGIKHIIFMFIVSKHLSFDSSYTFLFILFEIVRII